jgi:tRNA threonylcarbamoyladenosine biosynthesis protein TsaE
VRHEWLLHSAADTARLGAVLAHTCAWERPGPRLLYLSGELGAGKTTLAAALLAALGCDEPAHSPSYALIETYGVRAGTVVHIDCYRLRGPSEIEQLGLRDYFTARTLWLVEWPEHAGAALPEPDLHLHLTPVEHHRSGLLEALSEVGEDWRAQVERELPSQT